MKQTITHWLESALYSARESGDLNWETMPEFEVEAPRQKEFGDYGTNLALTLAKQARANPRQVAETLIRHLPAESESWREKVEIAGAGFINFTLKPGWAGEIVKTILQAGIRYGQGSSGQNRRVLIEFVSANPTGPLSVGHGRNGILGDMMARILTALGWQVYREFYINDGENSTQIRNFALSILAQFKHLKGEPLMMPEEGYFGDYVMEIAQWIRDTQGDSADEGDPEEVIRRFENWGKQLMLEEQERDLKEFRIEFDNWFSEQTLHASGAVERSLKVLKEKGATYEHEGALWLRSTAYGDDKDRVLVRANGRPTYVAADVAYHLDKYLRGNEILIDVLGADHHGYIKRMKAVVEALGYEPDSLTIMLYQLVRLFREGQMVRMSKRAGNIITLREVMDEVGVDATRFFFLLRSHDSLLDFDLDLAKQQSDKNPVYYVQYAHARICSILRQAVERGFALPSVDMTDTHLLQHEAEIQLIKLLGDFPEELALAGEQHAPHRLTIYAQYTARAFHSFYAECRVLGVEPALMNARICLTQATRQVLKNTLDLIGVTAPEEMERREADEESSS